MNWSSVRLLTYETDSLDAMGAPIIHYHWLLLIAMLLCFWVPIFLCDDYIPASASTISLFNHHKPRSNVFLTYMNLESVHTKCTLQTFILEFNQSINQFTLPINAYKHALFYFWLCTGGVHLCTSPPPLPSTVNTDFRLMVHFLRFGLNYYRSISLDDFQVSQIDTRTQSYSLHKTSCQ